MERIENTDYSDGTDKQWQGKAMAGQGKARQGKSNGKAMGKQWESNGKAMILPLLIRVIRVIRVLEHG